MDISMRGCRYAALNLHSHGQPVRVVCGDWRYSPFREKFDVVVGVDILYEQRWVSSVAQFIWDSLAEGGLALIVDPCRPNWNAFREHSRGMGFTCALAHRQIVNQGKTCVEVLRMIR
jgi:SAM-dependent methyltransferase